MAETFQLDILTPDRVILRGQFSSLIVPATLGYLGVLVNHAPLVASLTAGKIILKDASRKEIIFHSDGYGLIEVLKNKVTIILNSIKN